WLAASFKFLVPFSALLEFGRQFGTRLAVMRFATPATQAKVYYALDDWGRQTSPRFMPSALVPTVSAPGNLLPRLAVAVWACGAAVIIVKWFLSWRRVRAALHGATPLRTFDGIRVFSSRGLRERGLEPGVFGL